MRNELGVADASAADEAAAGFEAALADERLRNVRRLNALRFAGVTATLGLTIFVAHGLGWRTWQSDLTVFVGYWLVAGVLWVVDARADVAARRSSLAIPLVDMPAVFLIQREGFRGRRRVAGQAGFALGIFTLFIYLSSLTLQRRQLVVAAFIAALLETELQRQAGRPILLSAVTRDAVGDRLAFESAGVLTVRGRREPVPCFAPVRLSP